MENIHKLHCHFICSMFRALIRYIIKNKRPTNTLESMNFSATQVAIFRVAKSTTQ